MEANGSDAGARYQLGETYVKQGEIRQAKEEQKVLQDQDQELAAKLLASIKKREKAAGGGGGGGGQRQLERELDRKAREIYLRNTGRNPGVTSAPPPTAYRPPAPKPKPLQDLQFQKVGPTTVKQR